jgi:thiamine biosynthesis protein ThiI
MDSVLIRYHEIALKKGNRAYFTELLKRNILAAVKDLGAKEIKSLPARLLLTFRNEVDAELLSQRIATVFGVANFSLVERTERDIDVLRQRIVDALNGHRFESFRIETQRGDKTFPLTSPEINRQLGAAVKAKSGARVDLMNAEFTVTVEILPRDGFFGFNKLPGAGGLPVGASGRVASLISGVVVTETVFAIPGLGRLTVDAILRRDYPIIQGIILVFSAAYVLVNLLVDLSYTFLDPRIRY